jgi:prepilin-type N-terminal cleavage/methylation domain-containing protein
VNVSLPTFAGTDRVRGASHNPWSCWLRRVATLRRRFRRNRDESGTAPAREAGFTVVEVIVALAIFSAGVGVLFDMISTGLRRTSGAERTVEAGSLTQSLLAEIGTEYPVVAGEHAGEFGGGYHWHLKMQAAGGAKEQDERPVGLYEVSADLEWEEGTQRRSFRVNTLRIGPRASPR